MGIETAKTGKLRIGTIHYYKEDGVWIINFPTKNKWRSGLECCKKYYY